MTVSTLNPAENYLKRAISMRTTVRVPDRTTKEDEYVISIKEDRHAHRIDRKGRFGCRIFLIVSSYSMGRVLRVSALMSNLNSHIALLYMLTHRFCLLHHPFYKDNSNNTNLRSYKFKTQKETLGSSFSMLSILKAVSSSIDLIPELSTTR